jgi:hypothetical protein
LIVHRLHRFTPISLALEGGKCAKFGDVPRVRRNRGKDPIAERLLSGDRRLAKPSVSIYQSMEILSSGAWHKRLHKLAPLTASNAGAFGGSQQPAAREG